MIEIIQTSPRWWTAWLPVLGSTIVAAAAFTGVILSNRTNRRAIEAADDREWVKWQREKLAELADELLQVADVTAGRMRGCFTWEPQDVSKETADINNKISSIPHLRRRLQLVTGDALDKDCTEVFNALGKCFIAVGDHYRTARSEVMTKQTNRPSMDAIDAAALLVNSAQVAFISTVRKCMESMGSV